MRSQRIPSALRRVSAALAGLASAVVGTAALAACGGPSAQASPPGGAAAVGCRAHPVPAYRDHRPGDCVAWRGHSFIVVVSGYEVLMGNWKRYTDDLGDHLVCAGVNVENVATAPQAVSASQFRLLAPAGPPAAGSVAPSNGLTARRLRPGGQTGGSVCWPDPGAGGQYVGRFEPGGAGHSTEPRGIWLVQLLPRPR